MCVPMWSALDNHCCGAVDTGSWAEQVSCGQVLADLWLANETKQKMGDTLCGECVGGVCDVMCGWERGSLLLMALSAALL